MQHEHGQFAIEAHNRCARFHILTYYMERENAKFEKEMEDQQLMNSTSLKRPMRRSVA
jgi:hypothetical protein